MTSRFCLFQVYTNGFERPVKFVKTEQEAINWVKAQTRKAEKMGCTSTFTYKPMSADGRYQGK